MSNLFNIARQYIPGGVNSPVRAFSNVDESPVFIARAQGAYVFDTHQQAYVDYIGSWGPMILGHAHPAVIAAVQKAIADGLSFGAPTEIETKLAALICTLMPSIAMIRMVNSGTEAVMSAIRLARGFTGKRKIIKFNGCYHGHVDSLLVKAGSGNLTFGQPDSLGIPKSFIKHTLIAEYNDINSVEKLFQQYPQDIAGLIIEPVAGNMNCILPHKDFLKQLRTLCDHYQSLLIFDEVMTGFRVGLGGAQEKYDVKPDITTLGKIIGGGMPVGAFGGRKDIMEKLSPLGGVYQAGTLSGNPIAMTAGFETLTQLAKNNFYPDLEKNTAYLLQQLSYLANKNHIPFQTQHAGSLFGLFFTKNSATKSIHCIKQVNACDQNRFKHFFSGMLKQHIYFAPSAFEAGFLSIMHHEKEIQKTLNVAENVFKSLSQQRS